MSGLIKALQIFLKYKDLRRPTHCEHDVLFVASEEAWAMSRSVSIPTRDLRKKEKP